MHLADYGGAYSGSFIPMLVAVASSARDRGWSVELIFSEESRNRAWLADIERAGITYRFIDVGSRTGLGRWASWLAEEATSGHWQGRLTRQVGAVLQETSAPTILHTHFSSFDVAAAHAARNAPHAVVVWHRHGMRRSGWRPVLGSLVNYRLFARNVSEILCVGPHLADAIRGFAPSHRVTFVPNGIDVQRFTPPTGAEREQARVKLGIAADARLLVHFGWYWLLKGGDLYVAAVKSLLDAQTPLGLRAITVGRDEAQAAVDRAGVRSHVIVLEPTEGVRDLYAAADVFVSPSRSEGAPLAVLEALAMGLPVVASDIPGHAFVGEAVAACRLTRLSPGGLATSIRDVLELDPAERAEEQADARRWVLEHMDLKRWPLVLIQIYERLLRTVPRVPTASTSN